jgi:2,4-dienoyl-CoA reductase-like NADH-dependent reductase (Old Yellow Enzyme family)
MKQAFSPVTIGPLYLKNRFVRSATYDGMAERSGVVSEAQIDLYRKLAEGEVGLIVTGIASVHPSGRISAFQNRIDADDTLPGWRRLAKTVHECGGKIAVQLFHGGRESWIYQKARRSMALAPSVIPNDPYCDAEYRAIREEEILELIGAFAEAAARAREAGCDGVQLHAAHAYLFSQFLSPAANLRNDRWGGKLDDRLRFLEEVYRAARKTVGSDYPILVKLGVADGFFGGLDFAEGKAAAIRCARLGFDAIEVSQGLRGKRYAETEFRCGIRKREEEGYFRQWAREIHAVVSVPVIMVGGIRSPEFVEEVLERRETDLVAISRPLIREPDLIARWQSGDLRPSTCISCNRCFDAILKGTALHCAMEEVTSVPAS